MAELTQPEKLDAIARIKAEMEACQGNVHRVEGLEFALAILEAKDS
jgi:5'-3' exonuclease